VIAGWDKRAYAEAVRLIDEVRTSHRAKRNLMKLMAGLDPARAA